MPRPRYPDFGKAISVKLICMRWRQLRYLTQVLPWLGLALLLTSISLLVRRQIQTQNFPFKERRVLSGDFDTVVIDPGHGGQDDGASAHNLKEKVVTLDLAQRLSTELCKAGFRSILTRDSDSYVSLPDRAMLANAVHHAIFVSLHCDYTSDSNAKGVEIYRCAQKNGDIDMSIQISDSTEPIDQVEEKLSGCLGEPIARTLQTDVRGLRVANFFVTRLIAHPAVLVECGFLTNPDEAKRLSKTEYRQLLAEALAAGIVSYHSLVSKSELKAATNEGVRDVSGVSVPN
jgi:N-acetylmuramoyl-L-alanine amidase